MARYATVPVKICGVVIGSAQINGDGSINFTIPPNEFGKVILSCIEDGSFTGLSVRGIHKIVSVDHTRFDRNAAPVYPSFG